MSRPQVAVATVPGVGKVLVFGHRVLYVHTGDTKRKSTCTGACAVAWPPLLVSPRGAHHLGHVRGLGTFRRSKGHVQVTMDGHPLYFFGGDTTSNSAKGQGLANVFFTIRPNGTVVHVRSPASPVPPSPPPTPAPSTTTPTTFGTQGLHGTPAPVPTSPPPTNPPTTTTSPPTTTTTTPSGGGVSF